MGYTYVGHFDSLPSVKRLRDGEIGYIDDTGSCKHLSIRDVVSIGHPGCIQTFVLTPKLEWVEICTEDNNIENLRNQITKDLSGKTFQEMVDTVLHKYAMRR